MGNLLYVGKVARGVRPVYEPAVDLVAPPLRHVSGRGRISEQFFRDFLCRRNIVLRESPDGVHVSLKLPSLARQLGRDQSQLEGDLRVSLAKERFAPAFRTIAGRIPTVQIYNLSQRKYFIPRLQEGEILADLNAGKPIIVRGMWGTGKTSLLFSLMGRFGDVSSFYVQCGRPRATASATKDSLNAVITRKIMTRLGLDTEDKRLTSTIMTDPVGFLDQHFANLGGRALLIVDEAVRYLSEPQVLRYIAGFGKYSNVSLAVVIHFRYEAEIEDVFSGFNRHVVRPMNLQEIDALVGHYVRDTGVSLSKSAKARLRAISGGRPLEVAHLVDLLLSPRHYIHEPTSSNLTARDVNRMMEKFYAIVRDIGAESEANGRHEDIACSVECSEAASTTWVFYHYRNIVRRIGDAGRQLMSELAQRDLDQSDILARFSPELVQDLMDMTIVGYNRNSKRYYLNGELFRAYVRTVFG